MRKNWRRLLGGQFRFFRGATHGSGRDDGGQSSGDDDFVFHYLFDLGFRAGVVPALSLNQINMN
jgi:hypothetical protein